MDFCLTVDDLTMVVACRKHGSVVDPLTIAFGMSSAKMAPKSEQNLAIFTDFVTTAPLNHTVSEMVLEFLLAYKKEAKTKVAWNRR